MTHYKYLEKLDFKLVEESKHFRKFEKEDGSYKETLELNWAWDIENFDARDPFDKIGDGY